MRTIDKIENGYFDMKEFSDDQINFIKGLVTFSYIEGFEDGEMEIKNKIQSVIEK